MDADPPGGYIYPAHHADIRAVAQREKVELAVKNKDALKNPECPEFFTGITEIIEQ